MKKSSSYQHRLVELSFDSSKLNNFPIEKSIGHILAENEPDEKISNLREELLDELYDIINGNYLTDHQKKILLMRLTGKTQNFISEHLGITQSAVNAASSRNV